MQMPNGETASSRSDIELLFDSLPEPIDLEFEPESQTLYWTDRGEYPLGNTLNKAYVGSEAGAEAGMKEERGVTTLARHFHEPIGLKIDAVNRHVYLTDLGGTVWTEVTRRRFMRRIARILASHSRTCTSRALLGINIIAYKVERMIAVALG